MEDSYSQFVRKLAKKMPDYASDIHHAATGIAGEAGEVLDISKKHWVYGKTLDVSKLVEELGDIRFYYQHMLNLLEFTDDEVIYANRVKLSKRFPNNTYSDEDAIARKDYENNK